MPDELQQTEDYHPFGYKQVASFIEGGLVGLLTTAVGVFTLLSLPAAIALGLAVAVVCGIHRTRRLNSNHA